MPDKKMICKDCGQEFLFTEGEQKFYIEKGFDNEPQRCQSCRKAKKDRRGDGDGRGARSGGGGGGQRKGGGSGGQRKSW